MVLRSRQESHLAAKQAIDNKSDARPRTPSKAFVKLSNRSEHFARSAFILASLLRDMEEEIHIENCLRNKWHGRKLAAQSACLRVQIITNVLSSRRSFP